MALLQFGDFELRPDERRLAIHGQAVPLGARAFDLLMALVERSDRVVGKNELLDIVWPKLVVEENNLQVHIHALRKVLGPAAITTVPGRGYRFTAEPASPSSLLREPPRAAERAADLGLGDESTLGNLPAYIPALYGRADAVGAVLALLETDRLVTITGASGIGKTRLAQAVAHGLRGRYSGGAWMVELAAVQAPERLALLVAQSIGWVLPGRRPALDELVDALSSQNLLLVLDNCEHLVAPVAELVFRLLGAAPSVRLLSTSQELLHVAGERVYRLAPLAVPAERSLSRAREYGAVRLFIERARALDRDFELDEHNVDGVIDICAKLDGIALAIELAAARVPMLGVHGVQDRLGERLHFLTGGARVSLRRHQTLRAALDWSYQLLGAAEQKVFRRLAVFCDGFGVEGAQLVAKDDDIDEWALLDVIGALIDKSLVLVDAGMRPRYRLLETTRVYALEKLAEAGETQAWLRRHAEATRTVCERAVKLRDSEGLWAEMNNVRAGYAWAVGPDGDDVIAVALATGSAMVLAVAGLVSEAMQRLLEVEPRVSASTPLALAARYWQWLGRGGVDGGLPTSRCLAALQRAEAMFRELGSERHVHACVRMRAQALLASDDLVGAETALAQAEAMEYPGWPIADRIRRLRVQGLLHAAAGRRTESLAVAQLAYEMARSAGIERYVLILLADIAGLQLQLGEDAEAGRQFRLLAEKAANRRAHGRTLAQALAGLTAALIAQSSLEEACEVGRRNLPLLRRCGSLLAHCDIYAWLLACIGRPVEAAQLLGAADEFHRLSEISRSKVKQRARSEALRRIGAQSSAVQLGIWSSEGAQSAEEAVAALLDAVLRDAPVDPLHSANNAQDPRA